MGKKFKSTFLAELVELETSLPKLENIQKAAPETEVPPEAAGQSNEEQIEQCRLLEPSCRDTWAGNETDNEVATSCNEFMYCNDLL